MLRRVAIVAAFAATLAMPLLAGCGIRGPLYMPSQPPAPVPPSVPDPGLSKPDVVYSPAGTPADRPASPSDAPAAAPASAPSSR
ncbi:diaminopimelate decarboxylase [Cupriavidus gilardii J11]|uniref:Diaminopimelate decarboxylase n=1 Tax=Cupriavidus gilardii J11 TaxID=936133 RepID=A0A562BE53_9BURK|nr:lipoprotein [Cupriavidus gilardii]TWG83467.1 diaminopimelate decarboxylase [Cupriavidus gilardii J11]